MPRQVTPERGRGDLRPAAGARGAAARPRGPRRPGRAASAWRWRRPSSGSGSRRSRPAIRPRSPTATAAGPDVLGEVLADGDRRRQDRPGRRRGHGARAGDRPRGARPAAAGPIRWSRRSRRPGAGVQFAAAKALVDLAPTAAVPRLEPGRPHPRPVRDHPEPAPRRGHRRQPEPRAASSPASSGPWATMPILEPTGDEGFRAAAETADVELILISHDLFQGAWGLDRHPGQPPGRRPDRGLPVFVYGPLDLDDQAAQPADELSRGQVPGQPVDAGDSRAAARGPAGQAHRRRAGRLRPRGGRAPGPDRRAAQEPVRAPTWPRPSRPWPSR